MEGLGVDLSPLGNFEGSYLRQPLGALKLSFEILHVMFLDEKIICFISKFLVVVTVVQSLNMFYDVPMISLVFHDLYKNKGGQDPR